MLRNMRYGEVIEFKLPNADAINSGKTIAYRLQHSLLCKFETSAVYVDNLLTIAKKPR